MALDIIEDCGKAYRDASDTIKKLMNQAIFEKFYIVNSPDLEFDIEFTFKPPFDQILEPIKEDISRINRAIKNQSSKLTQYVENAKGHIREIFGYGFSDDVLLDESSNSIIKAEEKQSAKSQLQITNSTNRKKSAPDYSDADFPLENPSNMSTYSNDGYFFRHKSLSKVLLVEAGGVEPPSENSLTGTSPGAGRYLHSLTQAGTNTLLHLVASLMHGTGKAYRTHVLH